LKDAVRNLLAGRAGERSKDTGGRHASEKSQ
jgi:hypothetical protein